MTPKEFLSTIYLGDRACKGFAVNAWEERVSFTVDSISRVRGETWNYYTDEDIEDGLLVFDGVSHFEIKSDGHIPNDYIYELAVEQIDDTDDWKFLLYIGAGFGKSSCFECEIVIVAKDIYLADPKQPGVKIR